MAPAHYFSGLALLATGKFNEAKPLLGAVVGANMTGLPVRSSSTPEEPALKNSEKTPEPEEPETNASEPIPDAPEDKPGE